MLEHSHSVQQYNFVEQLTHEAEKHKNCDLVGFSGIIVQILLAITAFSVLLVKRSFEHPPRHPKIWFFDTFKQVISQLTTHALEEQRLEHIKKGFSDGPDQCNYYFVTIMIDTSIGVLLACLTVQFLEKNYITSYNLKQGNFYEEIEIAHEETGGKHMTLIEIIMKFWFQQLGIWLSIVFTVKILMFTMQYIFEKQLGNFSFYLLYFLNPYPLYKLILVMMIIPTFMNMLLFWTQDNFLQKKDVEQDKQYIKEQKNANYKSYVKEYQENNHYDYHNQLYDVKKLFNSTNGNMRNNTDIEEYK